MLWPRVCPPPAASCQLACGSQLPTPLLPSALPPPSCSVPPGRQAPSITTTTFRCSDAAAAYGDLQAAAGHRLAAGLPTPEDLGSCVALRQGSGARAGRGTAAATVAAALSLDAGSPLEAGAAAEEEQEGEEPAALAEPSSSLDLSSAAQEDDGPRCAAEAALRCEVEVARPS